MNTIHVSIKITGFADEIRSKKLKQLFTKYGFEWSEVILKQRRRAFWMAGPARWQFVVIQPNGSEFGVAFLECDPQQSTFVTPLSTGTAPPGAARPDRRFF